MTEFYAISARGESPEDWQVSVKCHSCRADHRGCKKFVLNPATTRPFGDGSDDVDEVNPSGAVTPLAPRQEQDEDEAEDDVLGSGHGESWDLQCATWHAE